MPTTTEGTEPVPGFAPVQPSDHLEEEDQDLDPSPPENQGPATTSPPSSSPSRSPATDAPWPSEPSPTSTDDPADDPLLPLSEHVEDALGDFGHNAFAAGAGLVNRLVRARTHTNTGRWLATEAECEAFAEAAARIATRHAPEELRGDDSDIADAFVMGTVALSYVSRNLMGEVGDRLVGDGAAPPPAAQAQTAAPPPRQQPPTQPPPAASGTARAEPPPPPVIPISL